MLVNQNFMSSLTLVRVAKAQWPYRSEKLTKIFVFFAAKPSFLRALRELRGAYFFTGNPEQPRLKGVTLAFEQRYAQLYDTIYSGKDYAFEVGPTPIARGWCTVESRLPLR